MATIFETIQDLGTIVTDAITAGNDSNIPERLIPTVLVRVATGRYKEVLPVRVPAETCIMGDELRATNVQPRTTANSTLVSKADSPYSIESLKRIEEIIGDIVVGADVTPTTGNNELQSKEWPYAAPAEKEAVTTAIRSIRRNIDFRLGDKLERRLPRTDYTTDNMYYATQAILNNKDFARAEVIAYNTRTSPNLKYSKTKCKQDVGYIIDAISYDLTYGGNWQSINAGLAYYDGREGTLQINSTEKSATINSYLFLKGRLRKLAQGQLVAPTEQTGVSQITSTGGSLTESNRIATLIDKIIDIIRNGPSSVTSIDYPDLDANSVGDNLRKASQAIEDIKPNVQEKVIDFISKNFGSFRYKSERCRRDLRKVIGDGNYDVALGTNYNAIFNGLAYRRATNDYNLSDQRTETVGALTYARDLTATSVTEDGSSAVGSSNAETRILASFNEVIDILENNISAADTITYPSPAGVDQNRVDAKDHLIANKDFIRADVVAFVDNTYPALVYDDEKCSRDTGYIVDGLAYDILYGGTHATTRLAESYFADDGTAQVYGQETQTVAAYQHLKDIVGDIIQGIAVTPQSGNTETQDTSSGNATGTEETEIDNKIDIIRNVITAGNLDNLPAVVYPDITWADAEYQTAFSNIASDQNDIIKSTIQYISDTYSDFNYNHAKCSRDVGLILDASRYDLMLGSNFGSIVAGLSYLREQSSKVVGDQKAATIAANKYVESQVLPKISTGPYYVYGTATKGMGYDQTGYFYPLYTNADDIVGDYHEHTFDEYPGQVLYMPNSSSNHAVQTVTDDTLENYQPYGTMKYTIQFVNDCIFTGSTEGSTKNVGRPNNYYAIRQLELNKDFIVEEVHAHFAEYFKSTVSATDNVTDTITVDTTRWMRPGTAVKFVTPEDSTNSIENAGLVQDQTYYVKDVVSNTQFTISETIGGAAVDPEAHNSGIFTVTSAYTYDRDICTRDVIAYIDALKWDLQWPQKFIREYSDNITCVLPANYESHYAARFYANSIIGSQEEDFYYLRNGTGLRLQSLDGLFGDLGPANEFGTSRPTAGAYASLDPGWGPDDRRVWITARSPYVQNLTTFGYAAVGQKIDGALHNGGNDSIVSNDFTQVISDGIGAWILNNGRGELVSVFSYYAHIAYLCESGGRMRATNGNNSYGDFGSVAEGVDPDEIPVTGIVDNKLQYNASMTNMEVDGDKILSIEYNHAGDNYSKATINLFGSGTGAIAEADEFRDGGVNRIRPLELNDSSGQLGGDGYLVAENTAQTGDATSITLAATDGQIDSAYPGMKLYITGGSGVGQYGIIDTYNSGSKQATIIKESDGTAGFDHIVAGTAIVSPTSSSTYRIEPAVSFTTPPYSSSVETLSASVSYDALTFGYTSASYTGLTGTTTSDGLNATFDIEKVREKYYVTISNSGRGYTRLDTITIAGSSLGGTDTTNDLVLTITAVDSNGSILAVDQSGDGRAGIYIASQSTNVYTSFDGESWVTGNALPNSSSTNIAIVGGMFEDGSTLLDSSKFVALGQSSASNQVWYSDDGQNWTQGAIPANNSEPFVDFGDNTFMACYAISTDVYRSTDGENWSVVGTLPSTGFEHMTYGQGKWVAVKPSSNEAVYSTDNGQNWNLVTSSINAAWTGMAYGNNRFVCVASLGVAQYSLDAGITWTSSAIPSAGYTDITYGQGIFAAVQSGSDSMQSSEDGVTWTERTTAGGPGGLQHVTFGNNDFDGKFVAIQTGTGTGAVNAKIGARARGRVGVANEKVFEVRIVEPGSNYETAPTMTITDPNNLFDGAFEVRIGNGVLGNPSFVNRGTGYLSGSSEIFADTSNGFATFFQSGRFIAVRQLTSRPVNGSNVVFDSLPGQVFKLVNTVTFLGEQDGTYTAFLNISPEMSVSDAPPDGDGVTMRIRYSQVRLTGHDFLDIGTGNFVKTNYPGIPSVDPDSTKETNDFDGGRVFFTSTDQDGNFRVGDLFQIEQSTGVATLNAEAFNIAGLQELSLGEVTLGGNSASITEFSTDPFFTANSDTVVPTQRAIKSYIEAQIGGGGASLNVNTVTAGDIFIGTNVITTTTGSVINIRANMNFQGGVVGLPVAYNYFLR